MKRAKILALLTTFAAAAAFAAEGETHTITLDPKVRFQKITGWEAMIGGEIANSPAFPVFKARLFDQAVNDLGLNRVRLEIRSGSENSRDYFSEYQAGRVPHKLWRCFRYATINDNDDPFVTNPAGFHYTEMDRAVENIVLPIKQRVEARGEKLFLNVNYVAFYRQMSEPQCPPGLSYGHTSPEEYAEFVLAAYLHLKEKYGLVPDAWEIHLEPDNTPFWRGKQIGEAIVASAKRLKTAGFVPAFIAPATTDMSNAVPYFDEMVKTVPAALEYLSEFAYHRYRGVSVAALREIRGRALQYKVNTAMLEHIGSGHEDLYQDLTAGLNSAWQQYSLAGLGATSKAQIEQWVDSEVTGPMVEALRSGNPKAVDAAVSGAKSAVAGRLQSGGDRGGAYYTIDARDPAKPQVVMNTRTRFLRQYFKFIRRDAVRIEAAANDPALEPVAFINANGGHVVVVSTSREETFNVNGLPAGVYGIKYTTPTRYDVDLADVTLKTGQALTAGIHSAGVITVYAKLPQ